MTGRGGSRALRRTSPTALTTVVPALCVAALAVVVVAVAAHRDLWLDEAMLYLAIHDQGWIAPWQALGHYEQAVPYGVYVIDKAVSGVLGFHETLLRLPVYLTYLASVALVWSTARRRVAGWLGPVIAAAYVASDPTVVTQATSFKHYGFELLASALVVWAFTRADAVAPRGERRAMAVFAGVAVASFLFSNTSIIAVAACYGAWLLRALVMREGRSRALSVVLHGAVVAVVFALWYALVIRPSTRWQLDYVTYRGAGLGDAVHAMIAVVSPFVNRHYAPVALAAAVVAVWVLVDAVRARRFPTALALVAGAYAAAVALDLAGVPIIFPRHVLVLVPPVALLLAEVLGPLSSRLASRGVIALAVCLAAAVAGLALALPQATASRQDVSAALRVARRDCSVVVVDNVVSPPVLLYQRERFPSVRVVGDLRSRSGAGDDASQMWQYYRGRYAGYEDEVARLLRSSGHGACLIASPRRDDSASMVERTSGRLPSDLADRGVRCRETDAVAGLTLYRCSV